jgi:uncharacterized protein
MKSSRIYILERKMGQGIREVIGDKRKKLLKLAHEHGAFDVRVFGSVARGEALADSDIDLLVVQDWSRLSYWGGMGLVVALEDLLGRKVDIATEEELRPAIREQVLREAIPL